MRARAWTTGALAGAVLAASGLAATACKRYDGENGTAGADAVSAGIKVGGEHPTGSIGAMRAAGESTGQVPANAPGVNVTQGAPPNDTTGGRIPNLTSTGEADRTADTAKGTAGTAGTAAKPGTKPGTKAATPMVDTGPRLGAPKVVKQLPR